MYSITTTPTLTVVSHDVDAPWPELVQLALDTATDSTTCF